MTGTFVFIVRYVRSLLGSKDVHLQDLYHRLSNPERSTIRSTLSPSCPCSAFLPALHTFQGRAVRLRFHDCAGSCWARSYRRRDAVNQCHRVGRRLLRIISRFPSRATRPASQSGRAFHCRALYTSRPSTATTASTRGRC